MMLRRIREALEGRLGRALVKLPSRAARLVEPRVAAEAEGQRLEPDVAIALRLINGRGGTSIWQRPVAQARNLHDRMPAVFGEPPPPGTDVTHSTMDLPGRSLRYRVYRPEPLGGRRGALVYFHGGGGVLGDLDSHDGACRWLCTLARCTVVAVDYRRAPEHPFPAAVDDAVDAFRWVRDHASALDLVAENIAIGGDSKGGTLATVACHLLREDRVPPRMQLLLYPTTDAANSTASRDAFGSRLILTRELIEWFERHYLADADRRDPRASPLLSDRFDGLPEAVVITAGFDPLRDEGEAYARAMQDAGVPVTLRRYPGLVHGFVVMTALPSARAALVDIATLLQRGLRESARPH